MRSQRKCQKLTKEGEEKQLQTVNQVTQIFEEYGDSIYAMICSYVNNSIEADDIYHDFFLSLVHKPIPTRIKKIRPYILRAIKNDVLDSVRRNKSYRARILRYADCQKQTFVQHDVPDTVIKAEEISKIFELIDRHLPHHEAKAVIERYYRGRSMEEIANEMNINKRSLSRYLCTGIKKLRKLIKE